MKKKNEPIRMRFMEAAPPVLNSGTYTVSAKQEIKQPEKEILPEISRTFYVGYRHFTLPEHEIYSVYPPREASGNYSNTLPHVVFTRRTLPWEHTINNAPWLALICLRDSEITARQVLPISRLLDEKPAHTLMPILKIPPLAEESPDDVCTVVDITVQHFKELFPRIAELKLLSHVKRIESEAMLKKADDIISHDGEFSVIVANRFVPSGEKTPEKSTAYLFSMEGCGDYLADGAKHHELNKYQYVRLVSLYSWSMYSKSEAFAGFRDTFEKLNSQTLSAGDGPLERGHVPKLHITRTGEQTVSLYRGPFLPYEPKPTGGKSTYTADGQIIYEPKLGVFDMSYAAAWQLGRLMTLENKPVSANIYRWRRGLKLKRNIAHTRTIFKRKQSTFGADGTLLEFLMENVCEELAENNLITQPKGSDGV